MASKKNPSTSAGIAQVTRRPSTETGAAPPTSSPAQPGQHPHPSHGPSVVREPHKGELHQVTVGQRPPPTHEQIAERAYEIWVLSGWLPGREDDNWMQAERELLAGCGTVFSHTD